MIFKNLQRSLLTASILLSFSGLAKADVNVVASIRPIHSLVSAVMGETGKPSLIVDGAQSPHAYSLKPSKAELLQNADLIFWIGPNLENFLIKPIVTIAGDSKDIELIEIQGLAKLNFSDNSLDTHEAHDEAEHQDHEHKEHDDHDDHKDHEEAGHDGHDHEGLDPHIWLDPNNAKLIVEEIVKTLSSTDVKNAAIYQQNGKALIEKIEEQKIKLETLLQPVHEKEFLTFHAAFQYFEHAFDLHSIGSIALNPEVPVGAARLSELKKQIGETNAKCIFSEPQFDKKLIKVLADGTRLGQGVLDPIGINFEAGPDLYINMMDALGKNISNCLSQK